MSSVKINYKLNSDTASFQMQMGIPKRRKQSTQIHEFYKQNVS